VPQRPYVLLSAAVSLDGYLDDASGTRLVLSGEPDLDRVDALRASCDAILVGAGTVRRDNPRLLVRSAARSAARAARGLPPSPAKVTVSRTGNLDPAASFFTAGSRVAKLVYVSGSAAANAGRRLGGVATVVGAGDPVDLGAVLADLADRGTARLMVEGGSRILSQFLALGLADELQLAVAPLLVGDPAAPRFGVNAGSGTGPGHRMTLAEVTTAGDVAVLRYLLGR
jgi:5-amino-6-(5-phosphoribosylamino)uracil reductase